MNEEHIYIDGFGVEWKRVYFAPNASIDSNIDPFSQRQFTDSTGGKKGTVGDMLDYSEEMSQRRAEKSGGSDPVKQKYFNDYASKRNGQRHIAEKKTYESKNVKVDYD
jgi:hypothetical protein